MDHYLEIRLLPDPEFARTVLMNALFAKLHRGLVDLGSQAVGLSFPDVKMEQPSLGERLRLHGELGELQRLMSLDWLSSMRDHLTHNAPTPIPDTLGYRVVRRVQAKSNPERMRRRQMKRKGISAAEATANIPDSAAEQLRFPYVSVKSRSTGHHFRLFIEHLPLVDSPKEGRFSHYGLSSVATVPWF